VTKSLWTPVSFAAGPLNAFEALHVEGGQLVRYPIIGVLIEEEVRLGLAGEMVRAGVTRSVRPSRRAAETETSKPLAAPSTTSESFP
jgi:hypothetical protein